MTIDIVAFGAGKKVPRRSIRAKAGHILKFLNQADGELSLVLVGNHEIRDLNRKYRKKDEPTDVLSFPPEPPLPPALRLLGDVVISVEQAATQAREGGETLEMELETLLIHGILHLLGYDHERSAREARRMQQVERKVQRALRGT